MSTLKYDPQTYKDKLIKYLKRSTSKSRHKEEQPQPPAPTTPKQTSKVKRKATPYHPAVRPSLTFCESDSDCDNQNYRPKLQRRTSTASEQSLLDRKDINRKATPVRAKTQSGGHLQKVIFHNISDSSEESEETVLLPSKCEYTASKDDISRYVSEPDEAEEKESLVTSSDLPPSQDNIEKDFQTMRCKKPEKKVKLMCKITTSEARSRSKMKVEQIYSNSKMLHRSKFQLILSSSDSESENFHPVFPLNGSVDYVPLKRKTVQNIHESESLEKSPECVSEDENDASVLILEDENVDGANINLRDETTDNSSSKTVLHPLKQGLLIIMHEGSKLYFHGLTSVKVLTGSVEVFGSTLTASSSPVEVFSPRGTSFLYFETKTGVEFSKNNFLDLLTTLEVDKPKIEELFTPEKVSLILCYNLTKPDIMFIEKYIPQQIFPTNGQYLPRCDFQSNADSAFTMKVNSEWDKHLSNVDAATKLFLCGGKSVGKSTAIRYAINKLLNKFQEILLVDLDPGQPEFTVPGCVSATIVKEPVFGPNYTHLRKPFRCVFVPNINIGHDSQHYIQNVEHLISSLGDAPRVPTLINYMGYIRGLGFETLCAVTAIVKPTYMVEIRSKNRKKNFECKLTYEGICETAKFLTQPGDIPPFPIHTVDAMTDDLQGWQLEPRQIREMIILAYLSKMLPENVLSLTHTSVPVYLNRLSSLKLIYEDKDVSPSAVNANLVALCSRSNSNSYICHGWGVVRAVNSDADEIYLLTPLLPEELELVDRFVLGSVTLPPSLYMTVDDQTGLLPYVCTGVLDALGQIPKRSHLPVNFK